VGPHVHDHQADDQQDIRVVDALGMPCPKPVIELAAAVLEVPVGGRVRLLADDVAAKVDVPVWCRMQRQTLVSVEADGAVLTFLVEKARDLA
jgi:TusA-related sulfurtransferase